MLDIGDMIIASLSKIWHIIPIVIGIILFKKYVNNKDKKILVNKNEENEKNGLTLEVLSKKKYEKLGFNVIYSKEDGIDLICHKEDKTFLIKCNNSSESKSIIDEDIITFHNNAIKYIKTNNMNERDVKLRYIILYNDVLAKSAVRIFRDNFYNCKYVIL